MAAECWQECQMFKTLSRERPAGAKIFDKEYGGAEVGHKRALRTSPKSDGSDV